MALRVYKTPKGTDLPLLNLRGKDYLEVKYRLVWFREEHPAWAIETEILSLTEDSCHARATVKDETSRVIATSHKYEDRRGFPDFIEKAETGAIGRALALCGFGTNFCADDLDEGKRIVDSPTEPKRSRASASEKIPASLKVENSSSSSSEGEFEIDFGKHKGARLKDVSPTDLKAYIAWLQENARKNNKPMSPDATRLKVATERYLETLK